MDLFDLYARVTLDTSEYEGGLDDAKCKISELSGELKTGLAAAAKVGAAAVGAASSAVVYLTKSAVDNYGEYEQLVDGVDTLFKQSADAVMGYAENAYQTAAMSANEYMETVTSFSASLLQSLDGDTAKAAEKAHLAITDMADNANKMGSSMESIQNAYSGFSRGNYTMLDNLKLGYAGTKEEMQRLLEDAEKVSGIQYDISSYADIVDAIHVVQTEMGITGTAALEASTTIQGSVSSMKAAWENLITGLGDENADLDTLIGNLITSAETAAGNLIPTITTVLSGMGQALEQLAPILAAEIPTILTDILPSVVSAGAQLLVGLATGLISALPSLVSAVPEILSTLVSALSDSSPALLTAGGMLISMLSSGILTGVPALVAGLPEVITAIFNFLEENLPKWLEAGGDFIGELAFGIIDAIPDLIGKLPEVITSISSFFANTFPKIVKIGGELLGKLLGGIIEAIPEIAVKLPEVIAAIVGALKDGWDALKDAGKYLLEGLWFGISDKVEWLKGKVTGVIDTIKGWFTGKDGFDEHSPSKWSEKVGEYVSIGLANGIEEKATDAQKAAETMAKNIYSGLSDWAEKQTKYNDLTLQDQLDMWRAIQNQFVEDSEQYAKAEEKVFDLKKQIQEEYYDKVEEITNNITALEENYQKTLSDRTQEIFDTYGLFDEIPTRQKKSGDELAQNLTNQIGLMNEFYTGLEKLTERGVGDGLVDEIREMGPSAIAELNALLDMSDEKLGEYASLYEEKQRLANEIATKELEDLRADTTSQIMQNLSELTALYDSAAPTVGKAFTDGLAEGIQNGMSTVINSAVSMATAAVEAVRNTLGIHSPSRVFAGIGENMALGLGKGWEDEFASIQNSITGGLDFGIGNVGFSESGIGMSSAAMVNSMGESGQNGGTFTFNLVLPDGTALASYLFSPMVDYARANGTPILNPA